ncbi:M10 family metallopeptidase [Aliiroseovarius sp. KMU-50]|uniref:M10 family metallopeptidase n=1 Tax=Aliiroseovarius salicola TaxID=3009082 RepID=A0ABT4W4E0_9RHOB|nr:M10 family metallopeptidase [Aliiroseovarius sp. KMU-50]MDA5095383.1 M10 family metallopeptidase [Aliiroseovarius sp. KMU-50]
MSVDPIRTPNVVTETGDALSSALTTELVQVGDEFHGTISFAGDHDWVEVNLVAGQSYVFSVWGTGGELNGLSDSFLTLRNESGSALVSNDNVDEDFGNYFSTITYTAQYSGTYYLDVSGYSSETGNYILEVATNVFTVDQVVNQLAEHGFGLATELAFSSANISVNLTGLTVEGRQLARWALDMWSSVTKLAFTEVSGAAGITFDDSQPGAFGGPSSVNINTGEIFSSSVNVSQDWLITYGASIGSYSYFAYLHEIGHALGLMHAGTYDGSATYGQDNHYLNDSWQMSIMSYFSLEDNTFVRGDNYIPLTPMVADIAAIGQLYGTTTSVNSGNTVWGSGSNLGGILGDSFANWFDGKPLPAGEYAASLFRAFTLVDNGGYDSLNLSTISAAQKIDLREGRISDVGGYSGNMVLAIGSQIEKVSSGSGSDSIYAHAAGSEVNGGAGNDTIIGNSGDDTLRGDAGNDLIHGNAGNDRLHGGAGYDTIRGGNGKDIIYGGDGRDRIWMGAGNDVFNDNTQSDTHGQDVAYGGDGNDTFNGGGGNDRFYGEVGNDLILGGNGGDRLYGGVGYDTIRGGNGNDVIYGGNGRDVVWMGYGNDVFHDNTQSDTHGRDVVRGGTGDDTINGGGSGDQFHGELGDDIIFGGAGFDKLYGGAGYDTLRGGNGNDTIYGDSGRDTIWMGSGNDVFHDNAQNDKHGHDVAYGGDGDDIFNGGGGNDQFYGELGEDLILGGIGSDLLYGGAGYDTIRGGNGNDAIYGGNGRDLVWMGDGNDVFNDSTQNDTHGHDVIHGGAGNDKFIAGGGNDVFYGEAGSDTFIWNANALSGNDTISDFEDTIDVLKFSNTTFSELNLTAAGDDVRVSWDNGTLILSDVAIGLINADDFMFV